MHFFLRHKHTSLTTRINKWRETKVGSIDSIVIVFLDPQLRDGALRRAEVDLPHRGLVRQAHAEAQQTSKLPISKIGKCFNRTTGLNYTFYHSTFQKAIPFYCNKVIFVIVKQSSFLELSIKFEYVSFQFLEREGVTLVNIDSTDIVDCKLKLILGLIW